MSRQAAHSRASRQPPLVGACERPHNLLAPLRWDDPIIDLVLVEAGRRRALAQVTGGDDLRWISGYVSVKIAGGRRDLV